jgi:hypothetical protein
MTYLRKPFDCMSTRTLMAIVFPVDGLVKDGRYNPPED